jgi:hypothetical protein
MVAVVTEESPNLSSLMVMIDREVSSELVFMSFTDETSMILFFKEFVVFV